MARFLLLPDIHSARIAEPSVPAGHEDRIRPLVEAYQADAALGGNRYRTLAFLHLRNSHQHWVWLFIRKFFFRLMRDRVCGLKLREDRRGRCLRREGPSVVALLSSMFRADQFFLLFGVWHSKVRSRYFLNNSWYLATGELRTCLIVKGDYVCVRAW